MANAYYENLRDRIGIIGFSYIPTAHGPERAEYLNKLNRLGNSPIIGLRILSFETFRQWSAIKRFRTITVEQLLDEMEYLANYMNEDIPEIIMAEPENDSES
jgi:hypothetical protein